MVTRDMLIFEVRLAALRCRSWLRRLLLRAAWSVRLWQAVGGVGWGLALGLAAILGWGAA